MVRVVVLHVLFAAQGMCGKTAETSDLQDLLIASLQGLSAWALKAREYGIIDHQV
ncbi:hypothetical protein, partial [Klebsiella pneumoniae]|uniref:hypothetical protein n=1 Tax=Klebsiella pneumoniae TaxID=573 RepID=UPI003EE3C9F7